MFFVFFFNLGVESSARISTWKTTTESQISAERFTSEMPAARRRLSTGNFKTYTVKCSQRKKIVDLCFR